MGASTGMEIVGRSAAVWTNLDVPGEPVCIASTRYRATKHRGTLNAVSFETTQFAEATVPVPSGGSLTDDVSDNPR